MPDEFAIVAKLLSVRISRCLIVTLTLWFCCASWNPVCASGRGSAYDLMLDRSGSMAGFLNAGKEKNGRDVWHALITSLEVNAHQRFPFGDTLHSALPRGQSLAEQKATDKTTNLSDAIAEWVHHRSEPGATLLLMTDNVGDSGSFELQADQEHFASHLRSSDSEITHVGVVLLRLPFNGRTYPIGGGFAHFQGHRALVLYVLSRGDGDRYQAVLGEVRELLERLNVDHEEVHVKPFEVATFKTRGDARVAIAVPPAFQDKIRVHHGTIWMRDLDIGDRVELELNFEINSSSSFWLRDVRLDLDVEFERPAALERVGGLAFGIEPEKLDIRPGESGTFNIVVVGSRYELPDRSGPIHRALMALTDIGPIRGTLTARVLAKQRNIELSPHFLDRWSYSDPTRLGHPESQGKIYRLDLLFSGLLPPTEDQQFELTEERLDINVSLRHPLAAMLGLIGLVSVGLVLPVVLVRWLVERHRPGQPRSDGKGLQGIERRGKKRRGESLGAKAIADGRYTGRRPHPATTEAGANARASGTIDVFVSYASQDRVKVARVVTALESAGYRVWWDFRVRSGQTFDELIERMLEQASCVLVVWSKSAVKSKWVRAEAAWAADRDIMISVRIDDAQLPLKFYHVNTLDLQGWDGSAIAGSFQSLLGDIRKLAVVVLPKPAGS